MTSRFIDWRGALALIAAKAHIAIGGVALLLAAGCGQQESVPAEVATPVRGFAVGAAEGSLVVETAVVRARNEAELGFEVGGRVIRQRVDAGQEVSSGQTLMEIDPDDLALGLVAAEQRVRATEAAAVRAVANAKRAADLRERGFLSVAANDSAQAERAAAAAALAAARADRQQSSNRLRYTRLIAPAPGVIVQVLVQAGQVVAPGAPVLLFARDGAREAAVSVAESALPSLPRVAVARSLDGQRSFPARLREVAAAADPATRTWAARYVLDGSATDLPLGASLRLEYVRGAAGLAVPLAALHDRGGGPGVWVIDRRKRVQFRPVRVVSVGDERAQIAPGALRAGEVIVALGTHLLRPNQLVRLLPAPTAALD